MTASAVLLAVSAAFGVNCTAPMGMFVGPGPMTPTGVSAWLPVPPSSAPSLFHAATGISATVVPMLKISFTLTPSLWPGSGDTVSSGGTACEVEASGAPVGVEGQPAKQARASTPAMNPARHWRRLVMGVLRERLLGGRVDGVQQVLAHESAQRVPKERRLREEVRGGHPRDRGVRLGVVRLAAPRGNGEDMDDASVGGRQAYRNAPEASGDDAGFLEELARRCDVGGLAGVDAATWKRLLMRRLRTRYRENTALAVEHDGDCRVRQSEPSEPLGGCLNGWMRRRALVR